MFKAMKQTHGLAAAVIAGISFTAVAPASASELYDIVVVPAEDDRAPIVMMDMEPAKYSTSVDTVAERAKKTPLALREAPVRIQSATGPKRTVMAWPYTARTIEPK